jgi:hypothetical protein
MAGLVPAFHAYTIAEHEGADVRDKRGHDD